MSASLAMSVGPIRQATHINTGAPTYHSVTSHVLTSVVGITVGPSVPPVSFQCLNADIHSGASPWTALEYCADLPGVKDKWVCHAPESCGCEWNFSYDLLVLAPRGCKEMGSDARVALYAPQTLIPYVSLPNVA